MPTDSDPVLMSPASLDLLGLLLGLAGSIALAVSLSSVVTARSLATDAHDVELATLNDPDPRMQVIGLTGTGVHVAKDARTGARLTSIGLWLRALSFLVQAAALSASVLTR